MEHAMVETNELQLANEIGDYFLNESSKTGPVLLGRESPDSLRLVSYQSNSHQIQKIPLKRHQKTCPNPIGWFKGIRKLNKGRYKQISKPIPCKTWKCPVCSKVKARQIKARAFRGAIMNVSEEQGYRSKYMCKMLTLSPRGREYRAPIPGNPWTHYFYGDHDPEDAYREMSKALDKLIRALKKHYGDFHYIRVVESQRSGYPHFHVVLVGSAVIPKGILATSRKLWTDTYGMGNVDIQPSKKFKSVKHAVYYCMKYLDKEPAKYHQFSRVFTSSQKALVPNQKKKFEWIGYEVHLGYTGGDDEVQEILCQNQHELEKWIWKMNKFMMVPPWEYHKAHDEMRTKIDKRCHNRKSDKQPSKKILLGFQQQKLDLKC